MSYFVSKGKFKGHLSWASFKGVCEGYSMRFRAGLQGLGFRGLGFGDFGLGFLGLGFRVWGFGALG